jgi:tetratricopeptide (TPR) repeat protein
MSFPRRRFARSGGAHSTLRAWGIASALSFLLAACKKETERPATEMPDTPVREGPQEPLDERVAAARLALERGDLSTAEQSLAQVGAQGGLAASLARARLIDRRGDTIGAVRELEDARARFAPSPEFFATAAEIHAASLRSASAAEELKQGLSGFGPHPALRRAKACMLLYLTGNAEEARKELEQALAASPDLPFAKPLMAQAHLLIGNKALGTEKNPAKAAAEANAALAADPTLAEARVLRADASSQLGDFDQALADYEQLLATSPKYRPTLAILYHRAATADVVKGDRERAASRYQRARALGLGDEDLGHGLTLLGEFARERFELGSEALERGQWAEAEQHFQKAVEADPQHAGALRGHGLACFRQERYQNAAASWSKLLKLARERNLELPEPVELDLARALHLLGRDALVRELLERTLREKPAWAHAQAARDMLAKLAPFPAPVPR